MGEPGGKLEEQPRGVARDCKAQSRHGGLGLKERNTRVQVCREERQHQAFWASKRDWRERKKERQVRFVLRFLASLGQRGEERAVLGHRKGEKILSTYYVPVPCWALS